MNSANSESARDLTWRGRFRQFANFVAHAAGSPAAFTLAVLVIVVWGISGPLFNFSDSWQLVINTGTTIITFLMVFLIQNMQNRDSKAIHLKLDELIRAVEGARNHLVMLENLSDEELERLEKQFNRIASRHGQHLENEGVKPDTPKA